MLMLKHISKNEKKILLSSDENIDDTFFYYIYT